MIDDANFSQFQLDAICHFCGATVTVIRCSGCGQLINTAHKHCRNCGLALDSIDTTETSPIDHGSVTFKEIVFDYGRRPIISESANVLDYLAAMVREVKDRAERMGLGSSAEFVFKMTPDLWEDISSLYACRVPDGAGPTSLEEVHEGRAELRARQSVFVDGMEHLVELDKKCGNDIFFVPESKQTHSLPYQLLTAILRKVGLR